MTNLPKTLQAVLVVIVCAIHARPATSQEPNGELEGCRLPFGRTGGDCEGFAAIVETPATPDQLTGRWLGFGQLSWETYEGALEAAVDPPTVIELRLGPCPVSRTGPLARGGTGTAYYPAGRYLLPRVGTSRHPVIKLCAHDLEWLFDTIDLAGIERWDRYLAERGGLEWILYHEVAHALIHLWDLPITGREEDAADQFATLLLLEGRRPLGDPRVRERGALAAALYFDALPTRFRPDAVEVLSDEHALNEQRYYNILCWVYGGAPVENGRLVGSGGGRLPTARASRCPAEYDRLRRAWREILRGRPVHFEGEP